MTPTQYLIWFIGMAAFIFGLLALLSVAGSGFWEEDRRAERAERRATRRSANGARSTRTSSR